VIKVINRAVRILTQNTGTVSDALERINQECENKDEIIYLTQFIKNSQRGVAL
jgi:acyl-[acyl carrier protein]--UDP-N-acetylglucosamine O-acyltransferase